MLWINLTKTIQNQRDQFNAQNRLVIDQNNAQWRRQIATADTVAINRANEINASSVLNMSETSFNNPMEVLRRYYALGLGVPKMSKIDGTL